MQKKFTSIRQIFILFLIVLYVAVSHLTAQAQPVAHFSNQFSTPTTTLFEIRSDIAIPKGIKEGLVLELNRGELYRLLEEKPASILLQIPYWNNEFLDIELLQQQPFSENFQIKGSKNNHFEVDLGQHYSGQIKNQPETIAAFSFFDNQIAAIITTPQKGNINLVKWENGGKSNKPLYLVYNENALETSNPFNCHTPDFDETFEGLSLKGNDENNRSSFCRRPIDVYIECDHITYQDFDGDVQAIFEFVVSVVHFSAALFHKEEIAVQLSELFVWESPDPFTDDDAFDALTDFRDHLQGDFNGTLAQLFSTYKEGDVLAPAGGLAYIGTVCSPVTAVGYSNIVSSFQAIPTYSWTVTVFSHELGHGLGSKHTHACLWGPNGDTALDDCYETEGDCDPGPPPTTGGTIMSYCHLSEFGVNLSNGFGEEPGDKIREVVANAACLSTGVADFEASIGVNGETELDEGETTILIAFPNGVDYYFQWYLNGEFLEGIIFPAIEVSGNGTFTVEVIHNGCIETSNSVTITTGTPQEVSMSCTPDCFACVGQTVLLETDAAAGSTFLWSTGQTTSSIEVSESGTYEVTITNGGNTSVVASSVNFTQETRTDVISICDGQSYTIGGSTYQNSGTYVDLVTDTDGCMVEVTTQLNVTPAPEQNQSFAICQGESISVGNSIYTQSGTYTDVLTDNEGCFFNMITTLTVYPTTTTENEVSICEGGAYMVGSSVYTTAGDYTDILVDINGCDSTIITHLSIAENYMVSISENICEDEVFIFGGQTYNAAGTYIHTFVASDGCDSTVTLDLFVHPNIVVTQTIEICEGENVVVGGVKYAETGVYTNHFITAQNCDSTIITEVIVHPTYNEEQFVSICEGGSYTVGDQTFTQQGNYTVSLLSVHGCDSLIHLQLFVGDEVVVEEDLTLCFGGLYQGTVYTQSTTVETNGMSSTGCDSTHILNITVLSPITIEASVTNGSCQSASASISLEVSGGNGSYQYQWSNGAMTSTIENLEAGLYGVTVTDNLGCSETADFQVETSTELLVEYTTTNVLCFGQTNGAVDISILSGTPPYSLFWSSGQIEEDLSNVPAGQYTLFLSDSGGCSSETTVEITQPDELELTISVMQVTGTNNDGAASVSPSGGVEPYTYLWSNGATTDFIENLSAGDYEVTVTDANGCTEIATVTVEPISNIENIKNITSFEVLPNPNNGLFQLNMTLGQMEDVSIEVYNVIGQPVGTVFSFKNREIRQEMDLRGQAGGVYFLVIKGENWKMVERLVIVR